ncbi:hypothetical protein [Gabonibacter chumensis]|uniref:hypothetical protein n=1 Tax=Gabonibacter chumensis TaxID=2972474 RepID=UPI002572862D|nr:hypothetical protein [Gabonibacter chumensis]MCR9012011.1 hypothetical protein [Gabonibacter chumensis]
MKTIPLLFISTFVIIQMSCSCPKLKLWNGEEICYKDSVFLGFKGNLDNDTLLSNHQNIYLPAFERLKGHLKVENNRLTWNVRNGAEIKISENIYDFITRLWKKQNKRLETGDFVIMESKDRYYRILYKRDTVGRIKGDLSNLKLTDPNYTKDQNKTEISDSDQITLSSSYPKLKLWNEEEVCYKDSTFLSFKGDLQNNTTRQTYQKIYLQALERMKRHLKVKNNRLIWNLKNGTQIKVSENIYNYIIRTWERENTRLETEMYAIMEDNKRNYYILYKADTLKIVRDTDGLGHLKATNPNYDNQ